MPASRHNRLPARLATAAPVFAALGDATRLQIVMRLCDGGPQSIAHLTAGANVSRQAVTKHLRALEQVQLVCSQRCGRERIWQLRQKRLEELKAFVDQISGAWDEALERLRAMVESA